MCLCLERKRKRKAAQSEEDAGQSPPRIRLAWPPDEPLSTTVDGRAYEFPLRLPAPLSIKRNLLGSTRKVCLELDQDGICGVAWPGRLACNLCRVERPLHFLLAT